MRFRNHLLTLVHRQSGDPEFAEILGRARMGRATQTDVDYLLANAASAPPEGALHLFAKNEPADQVNETEFKKLIASGAKPHPFKAMDHGPEHMLKSCPAPAKLWVCEGARVMVLRNLDMGIVNGSLGTVEKVTVHTETTAGHNPRVTGASIAVKLDGALGQEPFTYTFHTYDSERPASETDRVYKFSVKEANKVVARRIQIPLRLAWATSIHKAQGMSLDRVIIDFKGCFENGQAYTALSRLKTIAGGYLGNLLLRHLKMISSKALGWYQKLEVQSWA